MRSERARAVQDEVAEDRVDADVAVEEEARQQAPPLGTREGKRFLPGSAARSGSS